MSGSSELLSSRQKHEMLVGYYVNLCLDTREKNELQVRNEGVDLLCFQGLGGSSV